jgi:hypothetical protein
LVLALAEVRRIRHIPRKTSFTEKHQEWHFGIKKYFAVPRPARARMPKEAIDAASCVVEGFVTVQLSCFDGSRGRMQKAGFIGATGAAPPASGSTTYRDDGRDTGDG